MTSLVLDLIGGLLILVAAVGYDWIIRVWMQP